MLSRPFASLATCLLLGGAFGLAGAAEPTVGFNGWTNTPGVVEGAIAVHALGATTPKPPFGFVDYLPKGYSAGDSVTKWPVVFALLGASEQGDGTDTAANGHQLLTKMTGNGPLANVVAQHWDFPCIVISPQSAGPWSNPTSIKAMVEYVKANYHVDTTRLYMTGYVDGAAGTLRFATAFPNVLAGIVPIEPTYGPTTSAEIDAVAHLPMWMAQSFSDQSFNRRNAIAWVNQATQAETGRTSDLMAAYPGYGSINHYACDTDSATGLPLVPAGQTTTIPGAALASGSATVALPAGNLIANAGSFYPTLWSGSDAAPFARVTFGADATSYILKSVSATGLTLTHPYTGPALTADAHVTTPVGLVLSASYQPAPATWAWNRVPTQVPAVTTDTRVVTMSWQSDSAASAANTWLNGQVWDWLFVRPQLKTVATVTLSGLNTTYIGAAQNVTVTTSPSNLAVNLSGSAGPFIHAGSYPIVATISDPVYSGSATGTFTIAPAAVSIALGNLSAVYDGTQKRATYTTVPPGVTTEILYPNGGLAPTEPGAYAVTAVPNPDYTGTAAGTLVIAKAAAAVSLGQLTTTFTGSPRPIAPTTVPAGLAVAVTYNGSTTAPSALGAYAVVATVTDAHYQGAAAGTLTIAGSTATVALSGLAATYDGAPHAVVATTTPANLATTITYNGAATAPTAAGSYAVVATITDPNRAGSASGTLVIAKATATVAIAADAVTYDGLPHAAAVSTTPAGLATTIVYDFSASAPVPVNAGMHQVDATITDPNYTGTAHGVVTIATAPVRLSLATPIAIYDGTAHPATITTTPPGVACTVDYRDSVGGSGVPVAGGPYHVTAVTSDPNYQEVIARADMYITPATATITLSNLTMTYGDGGPAIVATTNPPGLPTTITVAPTGGPGEVGAHAVTATVLTQNYTGSATGVLTVLPAHAVVTLANLTATFDGNAHVALVTTTPAGLATTTTYNGGSAAPVAVGAYAVATTVTDANYVGSATATLTIAASAPGEPSVGVNGWTNIPGVLEGTITTCPIDTTVPTPPLGYVVYLPKGYNQADTTTRWPIVMYLAGIGQSGDGTNQAGNQYQLYTKMTAYGPLHQVVAAGWDFPAIIIAPQTAMNWNSTTSIKAEMDYAKAHFRVDPKRVYLTGESDGASAVLRYAATYPTDPAAILPIEAGSLPGTGQAAAMKSIPMWAAHCFADLGDTVRTASIAWVDSTAGADAGVASDCMANYPGYGLSNRNHYACDVDPATGFPLQPKGPTTQFPGASLTAASSYGAFNTSIRSSIYLMWSSGSDAKPFATVNVADGSATADYWAKAGVMIRDSTAPGAKYALVCQMPNNEVRFEWRDQTDGSADFYNLRLGGTASVKSVRLIKNGNAIDGQYSSDNVTWIEIANHWIVFSNPTFTTGLAVTAHDNSRTYTQTFSNVVVNGAAPGALSDADVGTAGDPGIAGSASVAAGTSTVTGGGSDIGGTADHFNYAWQAASGDVTISAKVGTNPTLYTLTTVYPTGFFMSKKYLGPTATAPITVTTPIGYNTTGSFDPASGWTWARDQHWDHGKPGRHIFTMFWYQSHEQGWIDTWSNAEVWNWLFSQVHP